MKKTRILATFFLLAMLLNSFLGCGKKNDPYSIGNNGSNNTQSSNIKIKAGNVNLPAVTRTVQTWSATITIQGLNGLAVLKTEPMTRSADGSPEWDGFLPVGSYNISVAVTLTHYEGVSEYFYGTQNITLLEGQTGVVVNMPLLPTASEVGVSTGFRLFKNVSVRIIKDNVKLVGATVTFDAVDVNGQPISVVTQSGATAVQLPLGNWNYQITYPGYAPENGTFSLNIDTISPSLVGQFTGIPVYNVVYNGNYSSGGNVPVDTASYTNGASVTVLDNTEGLFRDGFTFSGWNTQEDGNGQDYLPGSIINMETANIVLYAKWIAN